MAAAVHVRQHDRAAEVAAMIGEAENAAVIGSWQVFRCRKGACLKHLQRLCALAWDMNQPR
jgi:hypothetical protein